MSDLNEILKANKEPEKDAKKEKKEVVYRGEFRLVNDFAVPIKREGGRYYPQNTSDINCLEYQVLQGRVTKTEE